MNVKALFVGAAVAAVMGASAHAGVTLTGNVTYYNDYDENPGVGIALSDPFRTDSFTAISDLADYGGTNSDPNWPGGGYSDPSCGGNCYGFGADFVGDINVPTAGKYTFSLVSDDASYLFVNGSASPNAFLAGGHCLCDTNPIDVTLTLTAGANPFEIQYANEDADQSGIVFEGVPEPATWAMMVLGFLGLGAVLRSSRRKQLDAIAAA